MLKKANENEVVDSFEKNKGLEMLLNTMAYF